MLVQAQQIRDEIANEPILSLQNAPDLVILDEMNDNEVMKGDISEKEGSPHSVGKEVSGIFVTSLVATSFNNSSHHHSYRLSST